MIRLQSLLFIVLLITTQSVVGQEDTNWKRHKKLADKLWETHQYADAGSHYQQAWQLRSKDKELAYRAGECFYRIKDFKKAIQFFQPVKTENDRFELVGLKYARALKQDGQYEEAQEAFVYFVSAYQGTDKATIATIVANEIKGCELALKKEINHTDTQVKHLSERINSPAIEFAPIPYGDDLLYYSSTMKARQANLFRSQRKGGTWQKSVLAEGLPPFPNKHFANGTFTPDAQRFYFTLCDNGEGQFSKCEIYMLKRVQSEWSAPIRLHDYINIADASTTTQPWVVHQNGQEILYFASDRPGGFGGIDIWYATRNISSNDIDFTYPANLGSSINTLGDEITPFYDSKQQTLYFSSNGKVTLGGWDIFRAKGSLEEWDTAHNLGTPINSSADDFYYVLKPSGEGGFLVSNRLYGVEKISTQHEDIFEFGNRKQDRDLYALGQVIDSESLESLQKIRISLYEITAGREKLLSSKMIAQSDYRFKVLPNKRLRLVAEKQGYMKSTHDFYSGDVDESKFYRHRFSLNPAVLKEQETPISTASNPSVNNASNASSEETIAMVNPQSPTKPNDSKQDKIATPTFTSASTEISYKVQVIAVNYHNENHPRYNMIKKIGKMESERVKELGVTRVLLGGIENKAAAEKIKQQVIDYGFLDAFVVKYKDGKRIGRLW